MQQSLSPALSSVLILLMGVVWAQIGSNGLGIVSWFTVLGGWVFLVHLLVFIPALIGQSEKAYDLTGSFCFVSSTGLLLYLQWFKLDARALYLGIMVVVWSVRLGWYLGKRVFAVGKDRRFDSIKKDFYTYLMTWLLSALWVYITAGCAWAALLSETPKPLGAWGWGCCCLWAVGFVVEVLADWQKQQFRLRHNTQKEFISTGLWAYSRHPNYAGEIVMWFAIAGLAAPTLQGWQVFLLGSPLLVYYLIRYISGVNLLEAQAEKKFGHRKDYQQYQTRVPILWPRLGKG